MIKIAVIGNKKFLFFLLSLNVLFTNGQTKYVKVIDSLTKDPIPFATIIFSNNTGIITDDNGRFELLEEQYLNNDSIYVSFIGFKTLSRKLSSLRDSLLILSPNPIKLNEIVLTNREYSELNGLMVSVYVNGNNNKFNNNEIYNT